MDYELPNDVAQVAMRGLASAVRSGGTLSETQRSMLTAVGKYLLGCDIPPDQLEPISPTELAAAIPEEGLRRRLVHGMVALEIIADPVPPEVVARVQEFAAALQVDDAMLVVARDYSKGAMDLARDDYIRNSYPMEYYTEHAGDSSLHRVADAHRRAGSRSGGAVAGARAVPRRLPGPDGLGLLPDAPASRTRGPKARSIRCSRSTTGCTASPTTARRPWARSRCSRSSPVPSPIPGASATWS